MLTSYAAVRNLLRSRLVLSPPEEPEDGRVLQLFHNRAQLKKAYGEAQDEIHRLRDRIKLQEAATSRVRELLESLEARLAVPASGLQALVHYQLRGLWSLAEARIGTLVGELAAQREDLERRAHAAEQNRLVFESQQKLHRALAEAERNSADVRMKLAALQQQLAANGAWWKYFQRRALQRRRHAMQAEQVAAQADLHAARQAVEDLERSGTVEFPGLSIEARRAINRVAIAYAQLIARRLVPTQLIDPVTMAMRRSEPDYSGAGEGMVLLNRMTQIASACGIVQACGASAIEVKQIADRLREVARYASDTDTVPAADSLDPVLLEQSGAAGSPWRQNVLREDLWHLEKLLL
ncbi:MAG: hypothetical protein QM696_04330 [Steroidobacteraceae bacterium]